VTEAQRVVADQVDLPTGYALGWSGQYEYMERAAARLQIVIPATLLLIFVLLYFNFGNATSPSLVMLSVPFAVVGGFWLVYWFGFNLSVAVAVGFIALAGVAVATGVLVLTFIQEEVAKRRARKTGGDTATLNPHEIIEAVHEGASRRVRPVTMTALSTIVGLLPIMLLTGTGADVMRRIAAPMVGGVVTAAVVVLFVLMSRTLKGFEIRVSGDAPRAGGFGGFSRPRAVWFCFGLAGALAGLAGICEAAGPIGQLQPHISPGYGFTAIIVAFLGRLNPIGVLLAGIVLAISYLGGEAAQVSLGVSDKIARVFQGAILIFVLACDVFVRYRIRLQPAQRPAAAEAPAGEAPAGEAL